MESKKLKKFTYGHQFEPAKFSLVEILELCSECQPSRDTLEANIAQRYFSQHSKPNKVRLTSKAQSELLAPLLKSIANETRLSEIELNRTFDDVVNELNHPDRHIKKDKTNIVEIFDRKARRVFAKKELDVSDEELNEIEEEEDLMAEAIEDEIDDNS